MNAKVAKILRRFAQIEKLDYTGTKNYFQSRPAEEQAAHLQMMKVIIKKKGGDRMASQKVCDRPHKVAINDGEDYLPMKVKQPDGSFLDVDLCGNCAMDFKAWLNTNPVQGQAQPQENQQQPQQPAADQAQPANPADPAAENANQQQ